MNGDSTYTRRFFLRSGACALCAGALGSAVSSCDTVHDGEPVIDLAQEERLRNVGGAVRKRFALLNNGEAIFIIRHGETEFLSYAAQCTHQHVELNLPKEGTIKCPNHGSLFRVSDGTVIDGKAYDPLKKFRVDYDASNQQLSIHPPEST